MDLREESATFGEAAVVLQELLLALYTCVHDGKANLRAALVKAFLLGATQDALVDAHQIGS